MFDDCTLVIINAPAGIGDKATYEETDILCIRTQIRYMFVCLSEKCLKEHRHYITLLINKIK